MKKFIRVAETGLILCIGLDLQNCSLTGTPESSAKSLNEASSISKNSDRTWTILLEDGQVHRNISQESIKTDKICGRIAVNCKISVAKLRAEQLFSRVIWKMMVLP